MFEVVGYLKHRTFCIFEIRKLGCGMQVYMVCVTCRLPLIVNGDSSLCLTYNVRFMFHIDRSRLVVIYLLICLSLLCLSCLYLHSFYDSLYCFYSERPCEMSSSSRATGWRPSALRGAVVCLCAAPRVQLFVIAGNGWPHNVPRYH